MAKFTTQRRGRVFVDKIFAGIVEEAEGLFVFTYDEAYLNLENALPVSLTLPLRSQPYEQKTMIPFFDGLIPEGWLLDIVSRNWKINSRDRMALLLLACRDCIGNISVVAEDQLNEHS
jgi:serine/threonine-protein kinase HipA